MREDDLVLVLEWRNHDAVRRFMYTRDIIGLADHRKWYASASQDSSRHLLIFEWEHQPMGFAQLNEVAPGPVMDWGFYKSPSAPRGMGQYLGESVLHYAFESLGARKVRGQVISQNTGSIRFHQRQGFRLAGRLPGEHFDGQTHHDVVCFELLIETWSDRQEDKRHGKRA